jgi:hypothetical protein
VGFIRCLSVRANDLSLIVSSDILAVVLAWAITFTAVCIIILGLGFGPVGIGAGTFRGTSLRVFFPFCNCSSRPLMNVIGTLAAAFQGWMYGAFSPAGGIFATLTSMAMTGMLQPAIFILASIVASGVAATVWACGVGRGGVI